jgi:hypothetical protein
MDHHHYLKTEATSGAESMKDLTVVFENQNIRMTDPISAKSMATPPNGLTGATYKNYMNSHTSAIDTN